MTIDSTLVTTAVQAPIENWRLLKTGFWNLG